MKIDINPFFQETLGVLVQPYKDFVANLHEEGRITTEEVEALTAAIREAGENLAPRVRERLAQNPPSGWELK